MSAPRDLRMEDQVTVNHCDVCGENYVDECACECGVCMNCGADMDYQPWHPWCVDCDEPEPSESTQE